MIRSSRLDLGPPMDLGSARCISDVTSLLDSRVGVGVVINLTAVSGLTSYRIRRSNMVHCYA